MTGWLIDTNILSELRRKKPDAKVLAFVTGQQLDGLFVSTVTFAEIRFGIERVADAAKRGALGNWLTHTLRPMFDRRVLPVSEDVMLRWRILVQEGRRSGHTFAQPDLIIAATALHHGLTMVTRDMTDFRKAQVPVFNPWVEA